MTIDELANEFKVWKKWVKKPLREDELKRCDDLLEELKKRAEDELLNIQK
jgi:ribonuclease HI